MNVSHRAHHVFFRATFVISTLVFLAAAVSPVFADGTPFAPQTKIRLTIVQWMPAKGLYERWDALGGEYTISDAGAVSLPVLGTLAIGDLDNAGLTSEIAKRLQAKIGLVQTPAVTVEILEYPPIYVVGDVTTPGEYKFRSGLTVLQSLAMSGGPVRTASQQQSQTIRLVGDLREIDHSLLRSAAKIARLQAEMSGAKEIDFEQPLGVDQQFATGIYSQEKVILQARANALDRQSKALTELRDLLKAEIDTLQEKLKGSDDNIKSVEEQLNRRKGSGRARPYGHVAPIGPGTDAHELPLRPARPRHRHHAGPSGDQRDNAQSRGALRRAAERTRFRIAIRTGKS